MTLVAVAPKRNEIAFAKGQEWAPKHYVVRELREALTRTYFTSAHVVPYVVEGLALDGRQCRIKKAGLELLSPRALTFSARHTLGCSVIAAQNGNSSSSSGLS